jgi:hypothetical protein
MAVAFDAKMTGGNAGTGGNTQEVSNGTSISATPITVGASATLLVVCLSFQPTTAPNPTGITVTWGGTGMTAGPTQVGAGVLDVLAAIFWLVSPASGAQTLAASWTRASDCYMGAISFTGVDTSTPVVTADNQTSTTSGVTVTTANGDATVACSVRDSNTPTSTQTIFYGESNFNPGGGGSYNASTTGSDTHTFTYSGGSQQANFGIHVLAASGGGGPDPDVPLLNQPHTYNVYRM